MGKRIEEVIPEPSRQLVQQNYHRAIRENRVVRWEETTTYPNGTLVAEVSIAPVLSPDGIFDRPGAQAVMEFDRQVIASGAVCMVEDTVTATGITRTFQSSRDADSMT